jgi:hypothetical protein
MHTSTATATSRAASQARPRPGPGRARPAGIAPLGAAARRRQPASGAVCAGGGGSIQGDNVPSLHPVLEAVNGVTIRITATPALNAFKSWFWGLFAGE